jgi:plasmid stabilization system protein ParE
MNPNPGKRLPIKWDIKAKEDLKNIYFFIKVDSAVQAKKVKNRILEIG